MGFKKVLAKIYIQREGFAGIIPCETTGLYKIQDPYYLYSDDNIIYLTAQEVGEIFMEIAAEYKMNQLFELDAKEKQKTI